MNTEKDLLKNLFDEIKMDKTSNDFMENLMVRVEKEVVKQQRIKQIYNYLVMAAGIAGIIFIPALVLFFLGIDISLKINILQIFSEVHVESSHIMFALIILLLLIGDTLLRKHFRVL